MDTFNKNFLIGFFVVANSAAGLMAMNVSTLQEKIRQLQVCARNGMVSQSDRDVYLDTVEKIQNVLDLKPKFSVDQLEEQIKGLPKKQACEKIAAYNKNMDEYSQAKIEMVRAIQDLDSINRARKEAQKTASCIEGSSSRKK